jgi:hypothetical protein
VIDLRSDTVTKPTLSMREAMARAEVGDDVFGDDPTVKELEAETAALLGKESALFTPSGTMANQLAIRGHTEPGDEILVEANAHVYYYKSGGPAALSGVMCRCLNGQRGIFGGRRSRRRCVRLTSISPGRGWCAWKIHIIAGVGGSGPLSGYRRWRRRRGSMACSCTSMARVCGMPPWRLAFRSVITRRISIP